MLKNFCLNFKWNLPAKADLRIIVPLAIDTNAKWMERKYISWEDSKLENKVDDEFTEIF